MTRSVLAALLVGSAMFLSSCDLLPKLLGVPTDCEEYIQVIDVETSDRILRGTWTGMVPDYPTEGSERQLTLDMTASYVDWDSYAVSGTFAIEGEPPAAFEGSVSGGCAERYRPGGTSARTSVSTSLSADLDAPGIDPQSYPPGIFLDAEVRDATDALLWNVRYSELLFADVRDSLRLNLYSAEANPYHRIDRYVEVVQTSP